LRVLGGEGSPFTIGYTLKTSSRLENYSTTPFVYIGAPNNITKKGVNYLNAEINKRHPSDIPHVDSYGAISVRDDL